MKAGIVEVCALSLYAGPPRGGCSPCKCMGARTFQGPGQSIRRLQFIHDSLIVTRKIMILCVFFHFLASVLCWFDSSYGFASVILKSNSLATLSPLADIVWTCVAWMRQCPVRKWWHSSERSRNCTTSSDCSYSCTGAEFDSRNSLRCSWLDHIFVIVRVNFDAITVVENFNIYQF